MFYVQDNKGYTSADYFSDLEPPLKLSGAPSKDPVKQAAKVAKQKQLEQKWLDECKARGRILSLEKCRKKRKNVRDSALKRRKKREYSLNYLHAFQIL